MAGLAVGFCPNVAAKMGWVGTSGVRDEVSEVAAYAYEVGAGWAEEASPYAPASAETVAGWSR